MKIQTMNNVRASLKKSVISFAIMVVILAGATTSFATNNNNTTPANAPVQVRYLGQRNSDPVFEVNINNAKEEELYMVLKDEDGNSLYAETFSDKTFSKKFQFSNSTDKTMNITMSLVSKTEKKSQDFTINHLVSVVEDVVVTKLN